MSTPNFQVLQIQRRDGESLEDAVKRTILEAMGIKPGDNAPTISFDAEGKPVLTGNVTVTGSLSSASDDNTPTCKFGDHVDQIHLMFHGLEKQLQVMTQDRDDNWRLKLEALAKRDELQRQLSATESARLTLEEDRLKLVFERDDWKDRFEGVEHQLKQVEAVRDRVVELGLVTSDRDKVLSEVTELLRRKEQLMRDVDHLRKVMIDHFSGGEKLGVILLTAAEIQSGSSRVKWAEGLIRQLPETHEGRNSWLMNYAEGAVPMSQYMGHLHTAHVEGNETAAPGDAPKPFRLATRMTWIVERGQSNAKPYPDYLRRAWRFCSGTDSMFTRNLSEACNFPTEEDALKAAREVRALAGDYPLEAYHRVVPNE